MKRSIKAAIERNQEALRSLVAFRRAEKAISLEEGKYVKDSPLTLTQFAVLEALYNKGDLRIQDLIQKLLSSSGNMTVVIKNMVRDGYITKVVDPSDKRATLVSITSTGKKEIERILEHHYDHIRHIFSVLDPQEIKELTRLLKKLYE